MRTAALCLLTGALVWVGRGYYDTYFFALPAWLRGADESRFLLNGRAR